MKPSVFLFGTDHRYQRRSSDFSEVQHKAFIQKLDDVCDAKLVEAIAEECSLEALKENNIDESVPEIFSKKNGIVHKYCDPNREKRANLNISQENDIRASAIFNNWSEDKIQEEILLSHNRRESYWMDMLYKLNQWPVLFICGADHVQSFSHVLRNNDIDVEIIECDWSA